MTAKHPMIPFPVIVRAADGDIEAVNQIVRHYSGFIASRSMRPMKDEYGNTHMVCLLYTSPSPRDRQKSRMPSSA